MAIGALDGWLERTMTQVEDHWRRLSGASEYDNHKSNEQLVCCRCEMYNRDLWVLQCQLGLKLAMNRPWLDWNHPWFNCSCEGICVILFRNPFFTSFLSNLRDCLLVGLRRKHLSPTKILPIFSPTKHSKKPFFIYFFLPIFLSPKIFPTKRGQIKQILDGYVNCAPCYL